ncbi:MAG TPA: DUF3667 domain-containing protein [Allosphingosinicella sp.]|nr:DUF3667 domain-containing protein [Allosphingosinicella sp.]
MVDIEGVGEAVTGGMIARAVEPHAGEGSGQAEGHCLNCGTALVGPHCHACGQKGHIHRTLTAWWHDFLHAVLHLDGKLWHTLPLLAWRPGDLTRRYVLGERARFVSPLALFLFSVFLMFAVFSTVGGPILTSDQRSAVEAAHDVEAEQKALSKKITDLEAQRAEAVREKKSTRALDVAVAAGKAESRALAGATPGAKGQDDGPGIIEADGVDLGWFNAAYRKSKENPKLLIYKLQNNAYKFSWALIPISVPFVWLLFLHRRRYREYKVYDHTVFVTYSIAFMTLMVVFFSIATAIGLPNGLAVIAITLIPPIHMFRQLRGAYALSWPSALWRTFFLLWFSFLAATLFFLGLLTLGLLA